MKTYEDLIRIHNTPYLYDQNNKKLWGKVGKKFIIDLARKVGGKAVNVHINPSGSVDRGYVSGFIIKNNKFVYILISDDNISTIGNILYRKVKNEQDYVGGANNYFKIGDDVNKLIWSVSKLLQ